MRKLVSKYLNNSRISDDHHQYKCGENKNVDTKKTLNSMLREHDDLDILRPFLCAFLIEKLLFFAILLFFAWNKREMFGVCRMF